MSALKQWTITVVSPAVGPLQGKATPVEILLTSIGMCFALSCHAAFALRALRRISFEVRVSGRKAPQLPSRLANVQLEVIFDPGLPTEEGLALAAVAKQLCTVTNTLTSEPACEVVVGVVDHAGS
jgi:uncharacterized OsmC-like protein